MYKILVVDDESIIRSGIVNVVTGQGSGFVVAGEATNGKQALELIPELAPDLIITDICMPMANGLELIETAKSINPDLKVLVISGYDDFEYAQKALQLGVDDYILKPVQASQLIDILRRVRLELDQRFHFLQDIGLLQKKLTVSMPLLREWFFQSLIAGKMKALEITEKLGDLDLQLTGCLFGVALIKIKNLQSAKAEYTKEKGLIQSCLMQISESIFPTGIQPFPFFLSEDKLVILFAIQTSDRQRIFITLNQNLKRIMLAIQNQLNVDTYAALGRLYDELIGVSYSYSEAEIALQFSFLREKGSLINYEDINLQDEPVEQWPLELENKLLLQVRLGEKEQVVQSALEILNYHRNQQTIDPGRVKRFVFETTLLLMRTVTEAGGNISAFGKDPYPLVYQCENLTELEHFLVDFSLACCTEIEKARLGKNYSIVEKAKHIIESSLEQNEFSLDDVAGRLFISPNYLRSLFKQQVGESFVEYLTRRRMEKARILLDDVTLKVHRIAEAVGYDDQHYFSICFKKYYGLTPTDYREAKGFVDHQKG
jgi:two-component system, response regulator YesN